MNYTVKDMKAKVLASTVPASHCKQFYEREVNTRDVSEYPIAPANEEDEVTAAENDKGDEQEDPVIEGTLPDLPEVSIEPSPSQASQSLISSSSSESFDEEIECDSLLAQNAPLMSPMST